MSHDLPWITTRNLRSICWAVLGIEVPIQIGFACKWILKWGFFGGILHWIASAREDAIYAAAVTDFIFFIALVGLFLLRDFPADLRRRRPILFVIWAASFLVFPSLGFAVYVLWIKKPQS